MKVHTMLKKNITLPLSILLAGCARKAIAVCPMCTLAVGAGVGVARWLGIDNSITGLWIGGFTLSISIWTIDFLDRHGIKFFLKRVIVPALYYASVIIPLYHKDLFSEKYGKLLGISSLAFGIILGSIVFMAGTCWSNHLKRQNNGHVLFAYQKLVIPTGLLAVFSFILYCVTK